MEACIDMLADHGGAIFALVLYCGMELSSAMPPCDKKCQFCKSLRCRQVTAMSEEVGGPGGGLAGLCLVEGALELGVGVGTGRKELHLGLLTSIVTMSNKKSKIYDDTIKLVFATGLSPAATMYIMR
jgi:hypothetical protein